MGVLQVSPTQVILYEGPDDGPGLLLLAVVYEDVAPLGHGHGSERGAVSLGPAPAASVRLLGHVASGHGHTWHGRVTWSSMVNFGSILTRAVKEMFTIFLISLLKVVINFADKNPNFMQTHRV